VTARHIVFGVVVPPASGTVGRDLDALTQALSEHAGMRIERYDASNYATLAADVRASRVDFAWLPPIVYVRLTDAMTPIGSIVRAGKSDYEAALVVRADSRIKTLEGLRGARAGWVDPWSAAGFVLPRVRLALLGVDPRETFRSERFFGSHRAAMEALMDGDCDVAGTFARSDEYGNVVTGAWSLIEGADVRVLASFGAIPPDVIAVRTQLPEGHRDALLGAFRGACEEEPARSVVRQVFGGDTFREGLASGYGALKSALDVAAARGLFSIA
jgi:phosphate/phosphite/phosphonate ABC transporter binding protein